MPWYDSQTACVVMICLMAFVLVFSVAGLWVAIGHPENRPHIWVPLMLAVLSLSVIVSSVWRLVKRLRYHYTDDIYF